MMDDKEQRMWVRFCFLLGKSAPHPSYSPDLAPCDLFLFPRLKGQKKGNVLFSPRSKKENPGGLEQHQH
jgi:hypothetical protein